LQEFSQLAAQYGLALVFLNVLVEQVGLPVPAVPILVVAGALAADGQLSAPAVLGVAFIACALGDGAWYVAGRLYGTRVMKLLCRISLSPDSCVRQAETQFELAKEKDPKDPTPYYYDAIRRQAENKPVEAIQDLYKSIELNDNRAVYRSKYLLDQDRAARETTAARTYETLGLEGLARDLASRSLALDPSNASAHRFLSDALGRLGRQEVGQTSELLQAQLLQPPSAVPPSPQLAFSDLRSLDALTGNVTAPSDLGQLFEQNGTRLRLSGLLGERNTGGGELSVSWLSDKVALGFGRFFYKTDGYRENSDIEHRIYNIFGQFAVSPSLSIQAEYRKRDTSQGDISLQFDPAAFSTSMPGSRSWCSTSTRALPKGWRSGSANSRAFLSDLPEKTIA